MALAPKPTQNLTATIPPGQFLSGVVDITGGVVSMIVAPNNWTPANISIQVSYDGEEFFDLYDTQDAEVIKPFGPGRAYLPERALTESAMYLRIRSGSSTHPIAQLTESVIHLSISPGA
jgi:hypothetical protein